MFIGAKLGLDGSGFKVGLDKAKAQVAGFSSKLGGAFGASLSVGGAAIAIKAVVDNAGRLTDLAASLGITTEQLQEMEFAAKQTGASVEDMVKGMKNLAIAREKALKDPNSDQAKAFGKLGLAGGLKGGSDPRELFLKFSDVLKTTAIDMNSLPAILDLIGSKQQNIIPAMVAGLRESADEARNLGQVIGEDTVAKMDALGDSITAMGGRFKVMLSEALGPTIDMFRTLFSNIAIATKGFGAMLGGFMGASGSFKERMAIANQVSQEVMVEEQTRKMAEDAALSSAAKNRANVRAARDALNLLDAPVDETKAVKDKKLSAVDRQPDRNFDSLARIGGFTGSAHGGTVRTQEEIKKNTKEMVKVTEDIYRALQSVGII